jgi:hypothetical protein
MGFTNRKKFNQKNIGFANREKFSQERIWVLPIEKSLTQKKKV